MVQSHLQNYKISSIQGQSWAQDTNCKIRCFLSHLSDLDHLLDQVSQQVLDRQARQEYLVLDNQSSLFLVVQVVQEYQLGRQVLLGLRDLGVLKKEGSKNGCGNLVDL